MAIGDRRGHDLSETEAYNILRNDRRRQVIRYLHGTVGDTTLSELAEWIAERESGESPPPRNIRESVYNSLHQTHLPKLDEREIVAYDSNRKTIELDEAKDVSRYMDVVTEYGVTWGEFYRTLGLLSLVVVLAARLDAPLVSDVDILLWLSLFLLLIAASTVYQLRRQLLGYYRRLVHR